MPALVSTLPAPVENLLNPPGYAGGPANAGQVASPGPGSGWEIRVVSGLDYVTVLAWIPSSMLMSLQFVRMLDDIGSGTVVLSQDDPWWNAVTLPGGLPAHTLLDEECLWQVYQDGTCRFEFFGETITEQLADTSEQRQVTVTGPGTMAVLKWGMIAPPGFPNIILKTDSIIDSFDEVNVSGQGVLDTNIWTTASPSARIYITPTQPLYAYPGGAGYALSSLYPSGSLTLVASPGTTFLGASPYDATDTLISAQVTPIGVSSTNTDATTPATYGTGLNGSELTQFYIQSNLDSNCYALFGLSASSFYVKLGSDSGTQTKVLPAYDSTNHAYWMITEQGGSAGGSGTFYFWTSPDGENWTQQWSVVHSWAATNVGFFVTATYSTDNTQQAQLTNLNSNVTTPSYQGSIYLNEPMMGIWHDQFTKAQARGTIKMVSTLVTGAADTYGRAWTDVQNVQTVNGTDLYSFLQSAASVVNADFVMDPGFVLRVGQPESGAVALGVDRSQYIILREGYDAMAKTRVRARNQITTLIGGENSDGHEISASAPSFITEWGQREGWFQAAVQIDPVSMDYATAAALAENETEITSWTFTITPNLPGRTVFDDFDVGDWLGLERPDFSTVDDVRVTGIAVSVDSTGVETHELTLISYIQWLQEQLTYIANKLGGSFVNTQGATPVAPSKYGTGQVPTYFTPAASLTTLAGPAAVSAAGGAPLVYNPATGQYQTAGTTDPVTGTAIPAAVAGPDGVVILDGGKVAVTGTPAGPAADGQSSGASGASVVTSPSSTTVTDSSGNVRTVTGLQSDGTVTSVDSNAPPPATPDAPTVTGLIQGIMVAWDGLLSSASPLMDFQYVQVHVGTSSGFTPSILTLAGTLSTAGVLPVSGLTAGSTYYAKLVAVNTSGSASSPTAGVAGTAVGVSTSLLTGQIPANLLGNTAGSALNPNPFFNGGSTFGWAVTNGTLSATQSVPAGAPGAASWVGLLVSTAGGCLANGSPAPFPVTAGQPYVVAAWVYNPSGSSVSVAIGMNWSGGTQTFTCPSHTWTPLTVVSTAPGGTTSAYQVIGPTASGVTVNILGVVAAGQVPGQLIAAATVTATQIAAGTITATQIASGTITAGQIAANTITAAQIAATTITAAQIAANTITAAKLSAGIVVAGIVDATTVNAASYVATSAQGEFFAYGTNPGSTGGLLTAIAGSSGTDPYSNPYPQGLLSQQMTLQNQSSAPTLFSGSSILYSSGQGRLRYINTGGADMVLDRSVINLGHFTMTTQTSATVMSGALSYLANEAIPGSEYEIEIDGTITSPSAGGALVYSSELWVDGAGFGAASLIYGAVFLGTSQTIAYTLRWRMSVSTTGSSGQVTVVADGGATVTNVALGNNSGGGGQGSVALNSITTALAFDTTSNHTLAIYQNWGTGAGRSGHSAITYRTKITRRY